MRKVSRVLLIDDDPINNFVNEGLLVRMDIADTVTVLHNGDEAITYIENECMHGKEICSSIILLDHRMPIMNGIEFLEALNSLKITNREVVYVLLLAAHCSERDIIQYQKLGIQDFTSKPLSEVDLLETCIKYWQRVDNYHKSKS